MLNRIISCVLWWACLALAMVGLAYAVLVAIARLAG